PFAGPGDAHPDQSSWHQCPDQEMDQQLDTTKYADGPLLLALEAKNAAGVPAAVTHTVHVDNAPVTLRLSGPADAPITAGIQYITASASAGPSGVKSIACALDQGPLQVYTAATARIAIQGLGTHRLSCTAYGRAINSSGVPAASTAQGW